jgi:hypothetical protein
VGVGEIPHLCVDRHSPLPRPIYILGMLGNLERVVVYRSDDDGQTWRTAHPGLYEPHATLAFRTCAVRGRELWVSYSPRPPKNNRALFASYLILRGSHDGGVTYDRNMVISDGPQGMFYGLEQMTVTDSGALVVVYYQGFDRGPATLMRAVSTDDGRTWVHTALAQTGMFSTSQDYKQGWVGDYIGLTSAGPWVYLAYGDNSTGSPQVHFTRWPAP